MGDMGKAIGEYQGLIFANRFWKYRDTNRSGREVIVYHVNGKKVSKSTYNSKYKSFFSKNTFIAKHGNYRLHPNPINAYRKALLKRAAAVRRPAA